MTRPPEPHASGAKRRRWRLGVGVVVSTLAVWGSGCKDDADPVDVAFDGYDVSGAPNRPAPAPLDSGHAPSAARPPVVGSGGVAGGIATCCAALMANAKSAKDDGTRVVNEQAAKVCFFKSKQVADGKLRKSVALAQVRSSLLGEAPSACR